MVYTVGTAAKAVGKSKSTISKAIKKGRISAARKPDGSYEIEPVELFRVYPKVSPGQPGQPVDVQSQVDGENTRETIELKARVAALLEKVEDLRADKAFLQSELSKTSALLTHERGRPGLWRRLVGG